MKLYFSNLAHVHALLQTNFSGFISIVGRIVNLVFLLFFRLVQNVEREWDAQKCFPYNDFLPYWYYVSFIQVKYKPVTGEWCAYK